MLGRMNTGRTLKTVGTGLAVSAALAACGGGSGGSNAKTPSALDPANMVPASSVAYMSVTVRPQGAVKSNLIEAIDSVAGKGAGEKLGAKVERSLDKKLRQVKTWAGQHVGIALTGLPSTVPAGTVGGQAFERYVLLVVPTSNPAAAKAWLAKQKLGSTAGGKVVGHYVVLGGSNAFAQATATTAKTSLASDPGFRADKAQLGNGQLFSAYLPLHQLYEQLLPLLKSLPQYSGQSTALANGAKQAPPGSSVAVGVSALHNQFRMDVVEHGVPHTSTPIRGVAGDVSALPAGSWLAITLGGSLAKAGTVSKLAGSVSKSIGRLQTLGLGNRVPSGPLQFAIKDLLPALGPAELSVSGSSSTTLQAGLVMDPVNKAAGVRLAKAVKRLVRGLPISATTSAGRVAVTFGFNSLQQLLNPSTKLAQNPAFKRALGQLPAGGKADVYLSFSGIAALAALDPSAGSASTMRVLHRLDYLIAGGTRSHFRLVLATN